MLTKIKTWLLSSFISNWIRHGLTALSAILIAQGIPADLVQPWTESTIEILIQLLPVLISLIWSLVEKRTLKASLPIK
jgi:hypothetical protein